MTWSNVGDEPGHVKIPKIKSAPKGAVVRVHGSSKPTKFGVQHGEHPNDRAARLRRIARGER